MQAWLPGGQGSAVSRVHMAPDLVTSILSSICLGILFRLCEALEEKAC